MVRLVLFDIDGTLIHTGGAGIKAFERTFATAFGIRRGAETMHFAGRTDPSLVREFFSSHGIAAHPRNFDWFFDTYVFWLDHLLEQSPGRVCLGAEEFIARLRQLPRPPALGLLTGNIRLGAEIKLRRFGLWEPFVLGAFGDDAEDRNRIAAIAIERARRWLGEPLRGDQVLVVGDTPYDVHCGRTIGARTLAVSADRATRRRLRTLEPDWLAEDLRAVRLEAFCQ